MPEAGQPPSAAQSLWQHIEHAGVVLSPNPSRVALKAWTEIDGLEDMTIRFHRNHAVEHAATLLAPFLAYCGWRPVCSFGPYDDSLSFSDLDDSRPELEVVWLDYTRLGQLGADELGSFLVSRLAALRSRTEAPILVLDMPASDERAGPVNAALAASGVGGLRVCPQSALVADMGPGFWEQRDTAMSAISLSGRALVAMAQRLGLQWLPAAAGCLVRAVAVDLDNTLYQGVLGEDGVEGIVITDGHRRLQEELRRLRGMGVFVAVLSKNEEDDVKALFAGRADMVLGPDEVDAWAVTWDEKPVGLARAAAQLRIGAESFVVVDDNPGELAQLNAAFPGIGLLHCADPDTTASAVRLHPGLFRFADAGADHLRVHDLAAAHERDRLRQSATDDASYLSELAVQLDFRLDDPADCPRLAELASKTNQFSTALARLNELELLARTRDPDASVVALSLRDRLSDSGTIGLVSARRVGAEQLLVEDVCISCRALGRGLEAPALAEVLRRLAARHHASSVDITVVDGPRNLPARRWVESLGGVSSDDGVRLTTLPSDRLPEAVTHNWAFEPSIAEGEK
ncbi:MAG TPA: HAD-IIIC family phosphatase [Acidimicrobiales bacterium]|nr:HAD-IIIC family phosphatase [Acidimicrobiales bacterium]